MIIETRGLRKTFHSRQGRERKTVEAVRGVDLAVEAGEIFGFLGPNGAGKTTSLRMLATLIEPDDGEATIAGADLLTAPGEVRRRIGYVAQGGSTWDESTAREELVLHARMYGLSKADAQRRAERALDAFQLTEYADRKCKTYSGGQRRRVDIALGIIHEPKVVFLDEPTTGLDPQSRAHMWEEIRRLRAEGMTVFITTHYLDEADALCDRIAIVDYGQVVALGTPTELKREISGDVVTVGLPGGGEFGESQDGAREPRDGAGAEPLPETVVQPVKVAAELFQDQPYVRSLETDERGLRLYVPDAATAVPQVMRALDGAGVALDSIEVHRPSLDDVFLAKTGRSLRES